LKKVHIADHPFGLLNANLFYRLMEQESDLLICQRFLICTNQEKGTVIIRQYGFSNREIVFYNGGRSCRTCITKLLSINYKKLTSYCFF